MGILRSVAKLSGIEEKVKWSRQKQIMAFGEDPLGYHYVYVDSNFNVAIFLPKGDLTQHVMIGDITNASRWLKFDSKGKLEFDKTVSDKFHEWKINPKTILHRGVAFDPRRSSIYRAKVLHVEESSDQITDDWIKEKIKEHLEKMTEQQ